jgi:hypothetical protein
VDIFHVSYEVSYRSVEQGRTGPAYEGDVQVEWIAEAHLVSR